MKALFLIITSLALLGGDYGFVPISEEQAYIRANDEILYYCNDIKVDCASFHSPILLEDENQIRVYEWQETGVKRTTQIRGPYRRIGDLTFGLIGKNVTLGSYVK